MPTAFRPVEFWSWVNPQFGHFSLFGSLVDRGMDAVGWYIVI
jgi:hypothetical protein